MKIILILLFSISLFITSCGERKQLKQPDKGLSCMEKCKEILPAEKREKKDYLSGIDSETLHEYTQCLLGCENKYPSGVN